MRRNCIPKLWGEKKFNYVNPEALGRRTRRVGLSVLPAGCSGDPHKLRSGASLNMESLARGEGPGMQGTLSRACPTRICFGIGCEKQAAAFAPTPQLPDSQCGGDTAQPDAIGHGICRACGRHRNKTKSCWHRRLRWSPRLPVAPGAAAIDACFAPFLGAGALAFSLLFCATCFPSPFRTSSDVLESLAPLRLPNCPWLSVGPDAYMTGVQPLR